AEYTRPPATSASPAPSVEGSTQSVSPIPSPAIAVTLNDGGGQVTLDKEGNLAGLGDLAPAHQQAVPRALMTGHLNLPSELTQLSGQPSVLMGGKDEDVSFASFALLRPVGTIVRTTHPTFHWQSIAGASSYLVNVYDPRFNKVASSPKLSATQWTITNSLDRGAVYMWQVTAIKNGAEIKSP